MLAACFGVVTGRKAIDQLDVADQADAGVAAFDQIVAEDVIFGEDAPASARSNAARS